MLNESVAMDCEFAESISKGIQSECPICLLVLREPYQATCCGKSFCKECIEQVEKREKVCPTCRTHNFFTYRNLGLQQSLFDFRVYCTHKSKGCEWTGELRELDNHLNSDPPADKRLDGCPFTPIVCPLSCEKRILRGESRIYILKQQLEAAQREKEHLAQRLMELEDKQKKPIPVPLYPAGPFAPIVLTITDFEQCKREGRKWYSQPFYTHCFGYKMRIRVDTNGCGSGMDTHLSVYAQLMQGDFDDVQRWPFRGDVVIQLLNPYVRLRRRLHGCSVKTIHFNETVSSEKSGRVVGRESASQVWGIAKFFPLVDLQPMNGCIKLNVEVQTRQ